MTLDRRGPATIADVALAAGVSRAAVSKVIRNAYGVSPAMREKVTAAMDELRYRPRLAARAMRGSTFTIGVEVPDFGNPFITRMLDGVISGLSGSSYQVVIAPAEAGYRQGLRAIEALVDRQVDGVIAVSPRVPQADIERINAHTPIVMFGRHDESPDYDTVAGDDERGTISAMDHLLELGHSRIAHLTLAESDIRTGAPHGIRLREYLNAMERAGLADNRLLLRAEEGQADAYTAVRDAIDAGTDISAIFAAHDELAIGALRAIGEAGVDISVVGFDDVPIASHPGIGLTSVHQPGIDMGRRAVLLLLERIAGRSEPVHEIFETTLMVRSSTRPPRSV